MNSSLLNRRKQDQEQGGADSYYKTQNLAPDKKIAASCSCITKKNSGNRSILLVLIAGALFVAHSSHWVNQVQSQSSILNAEDMGSDNDKVKSTNQKILWTSEHLVDCQKMLKLNINHEDSRQGNSTGGGAPEPIFVTTKTDPPFQMSIHNPKDDAVSRNIQERGCWECGHLQKMIHALSSHPNSYFLDIGGNIGMWTLAAANAQFETFTIEPSRENYSRICETVLKNSFHDRVQLMSVAATSTPKVFELHVPRGNKGGTFVVQATGADDAQTDTTYTVQGVVIDSLNLPTNRPVVMKVDVEGHELEALLGALEFLSQANIVFVMMELRTPNLRSNREKWTKVFDLLTHKGLVPFKIDTTETQLDPKNLNAWVHAKHPKVTYFDTIWRPMV